MIQEIENHINQHQTNGVDWPAYAVHAVVYVCSTWPCGWEKEPTIRFFSSTEELDVWMHAQREWATLEDNYWSYRVYDWDWGPVPSTTVLANESGHHVPSSKAYCVG